MSNARIDHSVSSNNVNNSDSSSNLGNSINDFLSHQEDPSEFAVTALTNGNNWLVELESQIGNVEEGWADGASSMTQYYDNQLQTSLTNMASATGTQLQKDQANFQALQTCVSNAEQNYGNVVQGGTTVLNGTQTAAQQFSTLANTPIQQKAFVGNLLMSWS